MKINLTDDNKPVRDLLEQAVRQIELPIDEPVMEEKRERKDDNPRTD